MAEQFPGIPESVVAAGELIKVLRKKVVVTRADREAINKAKLKIAFWACQVERLPASRENLTYVLGPDAKDIMERYDQYLVAEADAEAAKAASGKKGRRGKAGSTEFWGGA